MEEESIPQTTFVVPEGLYEWLVIPFGIKTALAIFQRKMDNCFWRIEQFIAIYIDDILVFSENEEEHVKHLQKMLEICEKEGLILSPTKMKVAVKQVEFLGAIIGKQKIKLQPHIIKKLANFLDEKLKEKKGLRSWLGLLNYAQPYIPNLGTIIGSLHSKIAAEADKRFQPSDWKIVQKVRKLVQELPDMEIALPGSHIIIESDGYMEGWGGVCKRKKGKTNPRSTERVSAYASGKFKNLKSIIDVEIEACKQFLVLFKYLYMDRRELTLRTDCEAIIKFYNKSSNHKPSRVRWLKFADFITGTGI